MCEKDATSEEHAPPKCLFPDEKDLPNGLNLRKDLIKVPSCESHNSAKSHDDEFLLYILCMNIATNSVALRQFFTKIRRSYKRRPALLHALSDGGEHLLGRLRTGAALETRVVVGRHEGEHRDLFAPQPAGASPRATMHADVFGLQRFASLAEERSKSIAVNHAHSLSRERMLCHGLLIHPWGGPFSRRCRRVDVDRL